MILWLCMDMSFSYRLFTSCFCPIRLVFKQPLHVPFHKVSSPQCVSCRRTCTVSFCKICLSFPDLHKQKSNLRLFGFWPISSFIFRKISSFRSDLIFQIFSFCSFSILVKHPAGKKQTTSLRRLPRSIFFFSCCPSFWHFYFLFTILHTMGVKNAGFMLS